PYEVEVTRDPKGKILSARTKDGTPVIYDGIGTMSKSKNNGVDPQDLIDKYGADTARFFVIFASPPTNTLEWSDEGVEGSYRFLRRLWVYAARFSRRKGMAGKPGKDSRFEIHSVLKQANYDLQKFQFNTVASACMKILNALERLPEEDTAADEEGMSILISLLSLALAGCGFRLRGTAEVPFSTVYLPAATGGIALDLKRNIQAGTNAKFVDDPKQADAVLQFTEETRQKEILSLTGTGRVREFKLRYRVGFRVHDGKGADYVPQSTVELTRDVSFNDAEVLAKEAEEQLLFRDMQSDMVQQIMRHLGE